MANKRIIDMLGKVIGALTVISAAQPTNEGAMWNCLCLCGEPLVRAGTILRHASKKRWHMRCPTCAKNNVKRENLRHDDSVNWMSEEI